MKYLPPPRADLTFKRIFGEHPDLVISLLNALLPLKEEEEIKEIEYLPSDLVPDNPLRKYSIVDVRCRDKCGRQFLVEMQMLWSPEFHQRVLFNASKAYVRQLDAGQHYELLQPVYSLNIVNEVFELGLPGYYHHYALVHVEHSDRIIEGLQLIFVELPKFTPHTFTEKRMQLLWLRFLTEIGEKTREVPPELNAEPTIRKALRILEESTFTEVELYQYEKFWDYVSVEKALFSRGKREGRAEGHAKGLAEGMEKGKAAGKAEEQRLIASNMKMQGIHVETIAQCTGLSVEEINKL